MIKKKLVKGKKRSQWKIAYTTIFPLHIKKKISKFRKGIKVSDGSSTIMKAHCGLRFLILKTKNPYPLRISKEMIGFKFGEFGPNSAMGSKIHNTLKNKKRFN